MIGLDVDDCDMESGVEPEPIVGTYVIPEAQPMDAAQKTTRAPRAKKAGAGNGKLWMLIGIGAGSLALIAVIVVVLVNVLGSSRSAAPTGKGTALVDLLDDAAYNRQLENESEWDD